MIRINLKAFTQSLKYYKVRFKAHKIALSQNTVIIEGELI